MVRFVLVEVASAEAVARDQEAVCDTGSDSDPVKVNKSVSVTVVLRVPDGERVVELARLRVPDATADGVWLLVGISAAVTVGPTLIDSLGDADLVPTVLKVRLPVTVPVRSRVFVRVATAPLAVIKSVTESVGSLVAVRVTVGTLVGVLGRVAVPVAVADTIDVMDGDDVDSVVADEVGEMLADRKGLALRDELLDAVFVELTVPVVDPSVVALASVDGVRETARVTEGDRTIVCVIVCEYVTSFVDDAEATRVVVIVISADAEGRVHVDVNDAVRSSVSEYDADEERCCVVEDEAVGVRLYVTLDDRSAVTVAVAVADGDRSDDGVSIETVTLEDVILEGVTESEAVSVDVASSESVPRVGV